jgi:uncharacterized membrane protein YjjP (DUF1212 family)/uncharacterized membrane protein YjjB (DUF3815 family)
VGILVGLVLGSVGLAAGASVTVATSSVLSPSSASGSNPPPEPAGTVATPLDDLPDEPTEVPAEDPTDDSIDDPGSTVPEEPDDGDDGDDEGDDEGDDDDTSAVSTRIPPSVRDSSIPLSSIVLAVAVLIGVGLTIAIVADRGRRQSPRTSVGAPASPPSYRGPIGTVVPAPTPPSGVPTHRTVATAPATADLEILEFLLDLGEALLDAGDSVAHISSTIRSVAAVNGIDELGVLVLPSAVVLSLQRDGSILTEVRTGRSATLRLDQIDDVLRLVRTAERCDVDAATGRVELTRIRESGPPFSPPVALAGYVISVIGLTMILRGGVAEVLLAAMLGLVIGLLRLATFAQAAAYQVFWPLLAAGIASVSVFAAARVDGDLTVFPALVAPLIVFLPGALLTIGVLELATGEAVSGASRVAAGAMRLVLLAIGIVGGARLVGVPGGDIRGGTEGVIADLSPWLGVALFGIGVTWFYGARPKSRMWIVLVLFVGYAGQVVGGLFFGSALSGFFGALAMTPMALIVARQPSGPTPLVTFLPGFWLLVPGALGLEGVTRIIGEGSTDGTQVLVTTAISMVAVSIGVLLGLIGSGANPSHPWSSRRDRRAATST